MAAKGKSSSEGNVSLTYQYISQTDRKWGCPTQAASEMPRRKGSEAEEDEDYDPYDSHDEALRTRQRGNGGAVNLVVRSSRGRLVKARQYTDDSDTQEDEEYGRHGRHTPTGEQYQGFEDDEYNRARPQAKQKPAKRQRWVPHNPLIMGGVEDEEDSKEPQISDDDDESGEEGASRARRRHAESRLKGGSVPVRDETGKFIGVRPQTLAERKQATATGARGQGGGGIFKSAAVTVLREERRLMSTGEIARIALKRGYIKVQGRTPEATMASAMYTDVKRKEDRSTFIRPHEGLFGLREWLEEGVNFTDPVEDKYPDESTQALLRRNRLSATQQLGRANSRGSGAGMQRARSQAGSPAYDPYLAASSHSQGNSNRGDPIFDRDEFPPDIPEIGRDGKSGNSQALNRRAYQPAPTGHTPFGSSRGGPSPEIFKSRFSDNNRSGFVPTGKRSLSGSHLPGFQRANSSGQKPRKPSMSQQDSGNMLLLLNAVEDVKSMDRSSAEAKRAGLASRAGPHSLQNRRHVPSGPARRDGEGERAAQLTIQGFNASRIAAVPPHGPSSAAAHHSDQVNILNLPLPDVSAEDGSFDGPEVPPPGVEVDPSTSAPFIRASSYAQNAAPPPGAEAALQMLDNSFARAPLGITGSLSGPLAPAIRIPSELLPIATSSLEHSHELLNTQLSSAPVNATSSHELPTPQTLAPAAPPEFSAEMPLQLSAAAAAPLEPPSSLPPADSTLGNGEQGNAVSAMPDFGPPEDGAKRLAEVEAAVTSMESSLGNRHPKVGKGYLYLSRVYQCLATPEYYQKAQQALAHAYEICFACQVPR